MESEKAIRWVLNILLQTKTNKFPLFQSLHIIFFQGQFFFFQISCSTNACTHTKSYFGLALLPVVATLYTFFFTVAEKIANENAGRKHCREEKQHIKGCNFQRICQKKF